MNLSPEQKHKVIEKVAEMLVEELREDLGGSFAALYCVPLVICEKMTGLSRKTVRAVLPVIELSGGKHGVRLSDLQAYLDSKTVLPLSGSRKERRTA